MSLRPTMKTASTPAVSRISSSRDSGHRLRKGIVAFFMLSGLLTFCYAGLSAYIAMRAENVPPVPITRTPATCGLKYRDVTFYSRVDHVRLRGWFIPGVLPNGKLTSQRTVIMVHGTNSNRAASPILDLSCAFAKRGFAIFAFDLRGMGESAHAPLSEGYFEQRDVLGAVDVLRSGSLPYPELGRPHEIAAWGDSMGAATIILAAAQEPAIKAVVSDSGFAALVPVLESNPSIPSFLIPSVLLAARVLYGVDFYATRPVDVVARIAPRPIFFIQGTADTVVPPSNLKILAAAAEAVPHAHVQTWQVKGADHIQSFQMMGAVYVNRVVAFFTRALGPDTSAV